MVEQGHPLGRGVGEDRLGHLLGEQKPWATVRHSHDRIAEHLLEHLLWSLRVAQRQDGVGMGVNNAGLRKKGVEEGLYGGPGGAGLQQATGQIVHDILVRHVRTFKEGKNVLQADGWKVVGLCRSHVDTAALYEECPGLPAPEVGPGGLERYVAPPPHHQGGVGADEVALVNQKLHP